MKKNSPITMRKKRGFTLTEILVATALASLVAAGGYAAFSFALRYVMAGSYQVQFTASGRITGQKIVNYIENGKAVSIGAGSNGSPELDIMGINLSNSAIRFVTNGGLTNIQNNMLVYVPDTTKTNYVMLCNYAGPIPGESNMFSILPLSPIAAVVCFTVGVGTNVGNTSLSGTLGTGFGYQGVDIRVSATPRNIQRWYQ